MLPAILWLFFNTTANRHIHVLSNGYVVSHAHPFHRSHAGPDALPLQGSSTLPSHEHSKNELMLLSLFSEFMFTIITLIIIRPLIHAIRCETRFRMNHPVPIPEYYQVHHYHAPPFSAGYCSPMH